MKQQTYAGYLHDRYHLASEGFLTDFMSRRDGHLYLDDRVNLTTLAQRYGTPLEVVYCPLVTKQVQRMESWVAQARQQVDYDGAFLYAYATKANFAADVVQTALAAGVHYETSAATDVEIAHYLRRQNILPDERLILCNGSKEAPYLDAICDLRADGATNVIPVLDAPAEYAALCGRQDAFRFGVRERAAGNRDGQHPGNDRFGLTSAEIDAIATAISESQHELVLYHAMVGSQIENQAHFLATLRESITHYCRLRQRVPTLRYFNFGGGVPTAGYSLDFSFDYRAFFVALLNEIQSTCDAFDVPVPDVIGEFGRYTVATHSLYLFDVGQVKTNIDAPDWYLMNGSLMVSAPDSLLVDDQEFVVLPLSDWNAPARSVRLAGRRTCDSDDIYPSANQPPLVLPSTGAGLTVALCGVGAYQQMIAGRGGAHHCLSPEPQRVVVTEVAGELVVNYTPQQDRAAIMRLLGYQPQHVPVPLHLPAIAAPVDRQRTRKARTPSSVVALPSRRRNRERLARSR